MSKIETAEVDLYKESFKDVQTPDFTINSRILLRELVGTAINNGLELSRSEVSLT